MNKTCPRCGLTDIEKTNNTSTNGKAIYNNGRCLNCGCEFPGYEIIVKL